MPACIAARDEKFKSFNPSNGIGVVHAKLTIHFGGTSSMFQSLKRDRGGSCSNSSFGLSSLIMFQSLKRDRGGSCGSRIWLSFSHFTIDSKQKAGGFGREKPVSNAKSHHFQYSSPTTPAPARGDRRRGEITSLDNGDPPKSPEKGGFFTGFCRFSLREAQAASTATPPLATGSHLKNQAMKTFGSLGGSDPTVSTCFKQAAHSG